MTFKNPEFSNNSPYYDDFDDTKNFLKILFKPGYAVQARELTQLQTILQSQVAKFADSIFQDGSQVFGGKIQVTSTPYIRVDKFTHDILTITSNSADTFLDTLTSNLLKVYSKVNGAFVELTTARVAYFEPSGYSTYDNYPVVFYDVVSIADTQNGTFDMSEDYYLGLTSSGPFLKVITGIVTENTTPPQYAVTPLGNGYLITVDEGIFYVDGYFVKTQKQTISLSKKSIQGESESTVDTNLTYAWADPGIRLFSKPSHRIGYEITRSVVTATQDQTLKDPARGFYNFNAPGADRYTINLALTAIEYDNQSLDIDNYNSADFIQVLRTTKGVVDYIKNQSSYSQILDLFARRTEDESGSYTVKPFIADVRNHLRKDKYTLTLRNDFVDLYFTNTGIDIKVGAYIWPGTQPSFNPFTATTFNGLSYPVVKVVDVIPDYDTTTKQKSLKLVVELQNNQRLSYDASSYLLKRNSADTSNTIVVTSVQSSIDPQGTYSLLDTPTGNDNKLAINIQPGKAYIFGYEYETFAPRVVEYSKDGNQPSTVTYTGLNVNFDLGNYVYGSFAERDLDQSEDVNFESMPLMELVDVDTNTILIYPNTSSQVTAKILAWAPFKAYQDTLIGNMVDMDKLYNADTTALFPHESVIFVESTN